MIQEFRNKKTGQLEKFALNPTSNTWVPIQNDIVAEEGTLDNMLIGAGKKFDDLRLGVTGQSRPAEDQAAYDALKERNPWSVGGGEVISELAQIAPAATVLGPVATAAKIGKYAPLATDALASIAMAGTRAPDQGNTRAGNMAMEAAGSAVGAGVGRVLKGSKLIPGARELLDKGIPLTPRQASEGTVASGLDRIARHLPTIAAPMRKWSNQAEKLWHTLPIKEAAINASEVGKQHGKTAVNTVRHQFTKAYRDAWKDVNPNYAGINDSLAALDDAVETLVNQDDRTIASKLIKNLENTRERMAANPELAGQFLDEMDKTLSQYLVAAKTGSRETLANNIEDAVSEFRKYAPDITKDTLSGINEKFPKLLTIKRAATSAAETKGNFSPAQAVRSSITTSSPDQWLQGDSPLHDIINMGLDTVGRKQDVPLGMASQIMSAVPGLPVGLVRSLLNPTIGNNILQKAARKVNTKAGGVINPARVGAAIADEDELQRKYGPLLATILRGN